MCDDYVLYCSPALFYYILGNLSPVYRASLDSIQLVVVTKSSILQQYGADHVLKYIMEDIKTLEVVCVYIDLAKEC